MNRLNKRSMQYYVGSDMLFLFSDYSRFGIVFFFLSVIELSFHKCVMRWKFKD